MLSTVQGPKPCRAFSLALASRQSAPKVQVEPSLRQGVNQPHQGAPPRLRHGQIGWIHRGQDLRGGEQVRQATVRVGNEIAVCADQPPRVRTGC